MMGRNKRLLTSASQAFLICGHFKVHAKGLFIYKDKKLHHLYGSLKYPFLAICLVLPDSA